MLRFYTLYDVFTAAANKAKTKKKPNVMINKSIVQQEKQSPHECQIRVPLNDACCSRKNKRRLENARNCDIFVEEHHVLIYADVRLLRQYTTKTLNVKDIKDVTVRFNTKDRYYELTLPCLPPSPLLVESGNNEKDRVSVPDRAKTTHKGVCLANSHTGSGAAELWKLKRLTDTCHLQLDDSTELVKIESNFDYGFASQYKGKIRSEKSDLLVVCRIAEPHLNSPLQRSIDREIDEMKNFSHEQYKLNFVELQVPEGHDNPLKYTFRFNETTLSQDEECLLHNLTRNGADAHDPPDVFDQAEVECGLISILMGICYDIRSTSNEPTCESAWTRSILSSTLSYFEPFDNVKNLVTCFLRRSLIYPLYRNYDFGRLCVQDTIDALHKGRAWILKQLLQTHQLFVESAPCREVFNRYYIEDYIRYVHNDAHCSNDHLQLLAHNLKNILLDVFKSHLRLGLTEIETELLKELIHIGGTSTSEDDSELDEEFVITSDEDDDDTGDDDNEDDDDDDDDTESTESEENSVIEQCSNASKS